MATYLKITGNKEKIMSEFIEQQKNHWFFTRDTFTGIRTVHYKTDEELKLQIQELVTFLENNKIEFKRTDSSINVKSEYIDIHYTS